MPFSDSVSRLKRLSRRALLVHALGAAALITNGCAGFAWPDAFEASELLTRHFVLAARVKLQAPGSPVRIYIEGDGHAFNAHGRPSSDPTPHDTTLLDIAFADPHPNVVYLARPCQFVRDARCTRKDWSTGRFSKEAVDSVAEAVETLAAGAPVTLIGYSGGAQIAGLAAVTHPELKVLKIITIAGNLDHPAWCREKRLPPLTDSMDLTQYWERFMQIPQIHFVGEKDEVVPPELTQARVAGRAPVVVVRGATHGKGWEKAAERIYRE